MGQLDSRTCTSAAECGWICSDAAGNYTPGDMYQNNLEPFLLRHPNQFRVLEFFNGTRVQPPSPPTPESVPGSEVVLNPLLGILSKKAASGDSLKKFPAEHATVPNAETIFAFVQCTPDINQQNCSNCLKECVSIILRCCGGRKGGRVLKPSCGLRYEDGLFFNPSAASPINISDPSAPAPTPKEDRENSEEDVLVESLQYYFETIKSATDDFSDANKLGRGGFGAVYKSRLLNGQLIAVKRLSKNSQQGVREFKNEVELVARLQHRNLVRLLGFCLKADERILIYEYVPNASLEHFIFDPETHVRLDWETCYKIIQGIARGILYLHEDSRVQIIHRDLKASNILLDEDMNPKIADFGMPRLFVLDQTQADTKTIVGTHGYMAPKHVIHGRFSVKTDVFSFGVLVLEIIGGKKIGSFRYGENEEDLLSYAWRNWREETPQNIIDPTLTTSSRIETMRCIQIGLLCVQQNVADRSMVASVVSMFNSHSLKLSMPSQPAFYIQDNSESDFLLTTLIESDGSDLLSTTLTEPSNITKPYPR